MTVIEEAVSLLTFKRRVGSTDIPVSSCRKSVPDGNLTEGLTVFALKGGNLMRRVGIDVRKTRPCRFRCGFFPQRFVNWTPHACLTRRPLRAVRPTITAVWRSGRGTQVAEDATVARTCEPIEALPTCARSLALRVLGGPRQWSSLSPLSSRIYKSAWKETRCGAG
jgi:hypothetical protein